jgi:hypothetical protein
MNAFFEHHQHSIRLAYRCFDRVCDINVANALVSFLGPIPERI